MKPTQQQEKLKKQSIHSVMTITSMEYHTDFHTSGSHCRKFSPEGDGGSGRRPLPPSHLTFWQT